jgi:hypothetical protein
MSGARVRALAVLVLVLAIGALVFAQVRGSARDTNQRPGLMLLTSLPLMFGEEFSIERNGSPALAALQRHYRVVPISVTSPQQLGRGRILLMAQPRAQRPEDLVALDDWVRSGGYVVLLADPMLEWPSDRPLGDRLRPPPMFADTGLLAHWGLRLDAPEARGVRPAMIAGFRVTTISPGQLYGRCEISRDRISARCRVGKGFASVIADADLLDAASIGAAASSNFDALVAEISAFE